ncbi:MAG: alpha/beta hydrolase [Pseudomonadota bacterium]
MRSHLRCIRSDLSSCSISRRHVLRGGLASLCTLAAPGAHAGTPPIGEFIDIDGVKLHYWQAGEGVPVVLIHGASGNLRDWTFDVAPRLAETYRVIAFDRPGFGFSDRPKQGGEDARIQAMLLRRAAKSLDVEAPVIVGHSYGGAVAMSWAVADPAGTRGVVSLAGATMPFGGVSATYGAMALPVIGDAMAAVAEAMVDRETIIEFVERAFRPQRPPNGYLDYVGPDLSAKASVIQANAADLAALDEVLQQIKPSYPMLQMPIEAIHGTADTTVGIHIHSKPLIEIVQNGHLTELPGIGHMCHHTSPEALDVALARVVAAT